MVVDFPAQFGQRNATFSPSEIVRSILSTAMNCRYSGLKKERIFPANPVHFISWRKILVSHVTEIIGSIDV